MSTFPFNITNPGIFIDGLLTSAERTFVTDLYTASSGASEGEVLTWTSGAPSWEPNAAGGYTNLTQFIAQTADLSARRRLNSSFSMVGFFIVSYGYTMSTIRYATVTLSVLSAAAFPAISPSPVLNSSTASLTPAVAVAIPAIAAG